MARLLLQAGLALVVVAALTAYCDAAAASIYPTYISFTFQLNADGKTPQNFGSTACVAPCSATFFLVDGKPHAVNFPPSQQASIEPPHDSTAGYLNELASTFTVVDIVIPAPGTFTFFDTANPTLIFGTIDVVASGVPAPFGVTNPNQCFNKAGDEYQFCPTTCGPSTGFASCAENSQTFIPTINSPTNVTFPKWQINSFNNPVNCKAPCTATWIWSDPTPHTVQGYGPNADNQIWTKNNKVLGVEPNDYAHLGFTLSLTFTQPGQYGFICGVHGVSMIGLLNVYDGKTVLCLNSAINPTPTYSANGQSLTCV